LPSPPAPLPPKVPPEVPELLAAALVADAVAEVEVLLYCLGLWAPQRFWVLYGEKKGKGSVVEGLEESVHGKGKRTDRQLAEQALLLRPQALTHWLPYSWHS
jgi:hypothetical protein